MKRRRSRTPTCVVCNATLSVQERLTCKRCRCACGTPLNDRNHTVISYNGVRIIVCPLCPPNTAYAINPNLLRISKST